jgi:acetyl esterase
MMTEHVPDRVATYKTVGDVTLALHIFNPPGHKGTDSTPAIVFFFGGGWVSGSPAQFYGQSAHLAGRGMVAMCAEYRTKNTHGTPPSECVKDGKSAIRWIRSNASELGIDPDRLAAGGGSAGGQIAAATAMANGFNEQGEDVSVDCRPNALALFNPAIDAGPGCGLHERVKDYWEDFSPLHNIGPDAVPTTMFLGTRDDLIPVATAEEYKRRMEAHGVRCDLHLYDGQPHGFFNKAKYYETLLETDAFLVSLGFLSGEATLERE